MTAPEISVVTVSHNVRDLVIRSMQALAREQGLTLNTLVQGAWALLLSRYADRAGVIFSGLPSTSNNTPETVSNWVNV